MLQIAKLATNIATYLCQSCISDIHASKVDDYKRGQKKISTLRSSE